MTSNRRLGAATVVRHGLSIGAINPDADTDYYVDALWIHNDPALYRSLVITCGWTEETYSRWLARQMYAAMAQPSR